MHLHKFEKIWLAFGVFALIIFLSVVGVSAFQQGHTPAGGQHTVDPDKLNETAPFDDPGVHQREDGSYEVVMIGRAFGYNPGEIKIPANEEVTFTVTSEDVVHSFTIVDTNVNMMVVPGQVNHKTYTFDQPGTYLVICNEYCGNGHHFMSTEIEVVE
ncbi:cytochrome c oxidase subunit II [Halobacillus andaensis]|uniref:Cytochrome aa3 subunit 2 n=1 Tax=Halobacillus andaensis TaxID=1176239 RepID=A0A917EVX2_HALAA|nr:cytochrome c oxidase subunit II [Halobacillus andaensis]MBP2004701.1 cytochrome c oxidase subunit 2 [Halobacillus andaensis]GGF19640.1 cytochrome c oxidase subunit II [Halobacillus andaensis]